MSKGRGRPRQYQEETALQAAVEVFWAKGFKATSLDDLTNAMGMNRPSVYNAFGNKEAVYRRALEHFGRGMQTALEATLMAEHDVRLALTSFYRAAIQTYLSGEIAKGCLVMSTAVTVATSHPEIRSDLLAVVRELDRRLAERFQGAVDDGQLPARFDVRARAELAQAVLHSLSLRARAGEDEEVLLRLLAAGVETVFS